MTFKQEIQNAINSFSQIGVQLERVPTSFSFGTYAECRELFYEALLECDKSITTLYRKPEHEKIISWMVNTRNKGLILVGGCGLGKTSILTGVLPVIFQLRPAKILKPVSSKDIKTDAIFLKRWAICVYDVGTETIQDYYG